MQDKIKKCLIAGYELDIITQEEMNTLWNYVNTLQEDENIDDGEAYLISIEDIYEIIGEKEKEIEHLKSIIKEARKMIFDNYGVLDKYEIEMLDDILKGE